VSSRVPLPTLLSWMIVAFTVEVDNAFEEAMPHTTAQKRHAGEPATDPWLVSLPMWYSVMQYVPAGGVTLGELERRSFGAHSLRGSNPGMVRWRYVTVDDDPNRTDRRAPVRDWLVEPTSGGRRAQTTWEPLPHAVETRWRDRYGTEGIGALHDSLSTLVGQFDTALPDYVLPNAAHSGRVELGVSRPPERGDASQDLVVLLCKTLTTFTIDFELHSNVSLVLAANLLRAIGSDAVATRDLVTRTGVARETLNAMVESMRRTDHLTIARDNSVPTVRLTSSGHEALDDYYRRLRDVETQWRSRFGPAALDRLRDELEALVGDLDLARSPLAQAIEPPPTGWRAKMPRPHTLPHHPVISHRGGYPDGS
jgi:hypothetical protein